MPGSTLTVRLPDETRDALDQAAQTLRRSRAFIIKELVDRHLDALVDQDKAPVAPDSVATQGRFAELFALAERGGALSRFKTAEEVDAYIRKIRGDD